MLQRVAVCCSVLQCIVVRCTVLQGEIWCGVLEIDGDVAYSGVCCNVLQCVVVYCGLLRSIVVCCSVLQ